MNIIRIQRIVFTFLFLLVIGLLAFFRGDIPSWIERENSKKFSPEKFLSENEGRLLLLGGTIADSREIVKNGILAVFNDKIVWKGKEKYLADSHDRILRTDGYVYPAFIDTHNHIAYNFFPRWRPARKYKNRYEWGSSKEYRNFMAEGREVMRNKQYSLTSAKYGEIKSMLGGASVTQGAPYLKGLDMLVRNLESFNGLMDDYVSTAVRPLDRRELKRKDDIIGKIKAGNIERHFVHLGEGVDEKSLEEFRQLDENGLMRKGLVVIHGTAFGQNEFREMARRGIYLVWSPMSNMELYGDTTRVDIAWKCGVTVALAPDWSITGCDNILREFQFAWKINQEKFNGYFSLADLFSMITDRAAEVAGFSEFLGTLSIGKAADICVFSENDSDPFRNLLKCGEKDINLLLIGGDPVYGKPEWMNLLGKKDDSEPVKIDGVIKFIDVTDESSDSPESRMRLSEIVEKLKNVFPDLSELVPGTDSVLLSR